MSDKTVWVRLDKGHPDATVTKILVTGTVAEYSAASSDASGGEPAVYFHWQFHLHLQGFPARGVVVDMTPGGLDGSTGVLMVSTQNTLRATGEDQKLLIREVPVLDSSRVIVQGLVDMLTSKGLTRYKFNDEGMGCRWWCEL